MYGGVGGGTCEGSAYPILHLRFEKAKSYVLYDKPGTKVSKIINKKNSATKKKEKRIM